MKTISMFFLLIYWSFMISAPVVGKNSIKNKKFDREKKLKEQEEIRREQRLKQKELEKLRKFEELEKQSTNINLGLEGFEVSKTKEN